MFLLNIALSNVSLMNSNLAHCNISLSSFYLNPTHFPRTYSLLLSIFYLLHQIQTNAESLSSSNSGGGHVGNGGGEDGGEDTDVSGREGRCASEAIESGISSLAMAG